MANKVVSNYAMAEWSTLQVLLYIALPISERDREREGKVNMKEIISTDHLYYYFFIVSAVLACLRVSNSHYSGRIAADVTNFIGVKWSFW